MNTHDMPVIELRGNARQRGEAHGEALREPIRTSMVAWREHFEPNYGFSFDEYLQGFRRLTDFRPALERYTPWILEEVTGIAAGAGVDPEELLIFQHGNEQIWVSWHLARELGRGPSRCSTIAFAGDSSGPALVCHNLDWGREADGYQVLFRSHAERSGTQLLLFSVAGQVSNNGLNSHGVAVGDNALPDLRPSATGLPVFAIYRGVLECSSFEEAETFLMSVPHASGLNWMIGGPGRVGMYEASAGKVVPYRPNGHAQLLFHTNHPLANDDFDPEIVARKQEFLAAGKPAIHRSTYLRWASLQLRFGHRRSIGLDDVKAAVCSCDDPEYPVCRGAANNPQDQMIGFTLASCIWELKPGAPVFHLASGPAASTPFRTFTFND